MVVTRPDPRGPARTLSETRTDPTEFLGDPGRKKSPCGSGQAHVVEFSYKGRTHPLSGKYIIFWYVIFWCYSVIIVRSIIQAV